MTEPTSTLADQHTGTRVFVRAFTALRIFTGLVWLSNGLAKLFDFGKIDLGFFTGSLITKGAAHSIATRASENTDITPLGAFYRDVVLPNWGFFGVFLTIAELAIGIGLILGIASRLAAVGGLLLITPIWIMLWPVGGYLWEYPAEDLFPLVLLAIVPAGRTAGLDRRLAPRFGHRWPF
jgi:uncharacterized membrane protein YphA (DoxX/SURF4 family)